MIDKKIMVGALTAIGASLCCITPVLAVLAGSTGFASSFSWMEPFRPYLIALTVLVLVYAWWDKLKPKKQEIECACEADETGKVSFWYSTTFLALVTVFSAVMLSFPYWGETLIKSEKTATVVMDKANLFKSTIHIEGMTCPACEATVEKIGSEIKGVVNIKASTKEKRAIVEFDKTQTDIQSIMKAIATTGYKPLGYEDASGKHKVDDIKVFKHKEDKAGAAPKCSAGKCGAEKCGAGKCGDAK